MVRTPEEIGRILQEVDEAILRSKRLLTTSEQSIVNAHLLVAELAWIKHHSKQALRTLNTARARYAQSFPLLPGPLKQDGEE